MRRHILYLYAAALLTAACSGDDAAGTPSVGSTEIVVFNAKVADEEHPVTRTPANAIENVSALSAKEGFGVFGSYTGLRKYRESSVSSDFMYNEHVYSNDNGASWEYGIPKYWPNGEGDVEGTTGQFPHYVSFFAYAPYSDGNDTNPDTNPAGYCIPSFSHQGEPGNPWVTYRLHTDVTKQVDLLCAEPLLDQTKPEKAEKLTFLFKHALACVGDKVSIDCSSAMKSQLSTRLDGGISNIRLDVTKLEIVYTLTSKARLVLWNGGEPNWELIYSEAPVCTRTVTLVDADHPVVAYAYDTNDITVKNIWDNMGVYYIPIGLPGFPQTARVDLAYHVSTSIDGIDWISDTSKEGSATLYLKDYADTAYQPGKHLYINIAVNDVTFTVTAAIAPWEEETPKDVEAI